MKYRTKDGDMIDMICHKYYGDAPCSVETVLDINTGLAGHGPLLPAGIVMNLPEFDATERPALRLWD